jgi:ABC-2 type transport system ATP-binding protein
MNAISVRGLAKSFGSFKAVDGISFEVEAGSIFGLLGANGAGKSTTIRMLCGLLAPTSGIAEVAGFDIGKDPDSVKRNIGYMSQRFSLYEDLTVVENIRFFAGVYGLSDRKIAERTDWAVALAGLAGRESSLTRELSGGWKQRLALGCSVIHEPRIVFLDEPTGGVDPVSRRVFWDLINDLVQGGSTVLVTTHYLDEAEYCNRIVLMHAGRIVAEGSPRELKREHITTTMLEVECPSPIAAMEALKGEDWIAGTSAFGAYLHVNLVENGDSGRVASALASKGIRASRVEAIMPSLEDVFIRLIERESGRAG